MIAQAGIVSSHVGLLWLDVDFLQLVKTSGIIPNAVMGFLAAASLLSWTIILSKGFMLRSAQSSNRKFLRAFRKSTRLEAVAAASEQYRAAPLVGVFDFGYSEVCRQMASRSKLSNQAALERTLQLGVSEELSRLERNMNWLATIASVSPFIGLFGTVSGIIDAFQGLGLTGNTSLKAVGSRHCRSAAGYRHGFVRGDPCEHLLQPLRQPHPRDRGADGGFLAGVPQFDGTER